VATAPALIGPVRHSSARGAGQRREDADAERGHRVRNGGLRVAVERRDADRVTVTLAGDCDGGSGEPFAAQLAPVEQKRGRRSP